MIVKKDFIKNSMIINFLIGLVVFVSINIILAKIIINKKIDLTQDNLFTLTSNTKNISNSFKKRSINNKNNSLNVVGIFFKSKFLLGIK